MKHSIENRLVAVTNYTGTQDLPWLIARSLPPKETLGSDPNWAVARACMSPEEYMAFGRDGHAWKFLRGKPDKAQLCINACRAVVAKTCKAMNLECDWSRSA